MIYQDYHFKLIWDLFVTFVLLFVCAYIPLNMALKINSSFWCKAMYVGDAIFLTDLVLNFFTTIP